MSGERRRRYGNRKIYRQRTFILLFSVSVLLCAAMVMAGGFTARAQEEEEEILCKYYTSIRIGSGDTLWTLADTYCDTDIRSREAFVKEVARINHLLDERIVEGDWLIVPYYSTEFK